MMQTVLTKYWVALHVGLIWLVSLCGLSQPLASGYVPLFWFSLMAVEAMVLLPAVRKGETLADARLRVGHGVVHAAFFYVGLAVIGMLCAQWLNSGCTLAYQADADTWQYSAPPVPWAPFSVSARDAVADLSVFAACIVGGLILSQGVSKTAKRYLLQVAATVSGAVALFLVWKASRGAVPNHLLIQAPQALALGTFFGFWLVMGMGAYVDALVRRQRATELLFIFSFLGNLLGMLYFASALAVVVYAFLVLCLIIYWLFYLNSNAPKATQLKLFLVTLTVVAGVVLAVLFLFPGNPVLAKLKSLLEWDSFWNAFVANRGVRTAAAVKIWKEHPWAGVGANGFFHFVGTAVEGKDWALIKSDQAYVLNDFMQVLCEYGALGAGLLAACIVVLLIPVCYRARVEWAFGSGGARGGRVFLLRISPIVLTGVLATGLCFGESLIASPYQSAAVLISWFYVMAALPAFLPATERAAKG